MSDGVIELKLPAKFRPMFKPKRIKVAFGGRGGAKTESFCRVALTMGLNGWRFLCLRQRMNSIDDSIHNALKAIIESDGFSESYEVLDNCIRTTKGGDAFRYAQLGSNLGSIRSKFGYRVALVEEADEVSADALNVLEPTIRADGSELWFALNPVREDGAVYSRYIAPHIRTILANGFYEDEDLYVFKVGLEDNPWAPEILRRQSAKMKAEDPDLWAHVWGGEPKRDLDDVIIQPKWVDAAINAHKRLGFRAEGVISAGFDVADEGDDEKAVAVRHGVVIKKVDYWSQGDVSDAIDRAFTIAYDMRANCLVYDAVGVGASVKVGLKKRLEGANMIVTSFRGGDAVDNPEAIYNEDRKNCDTFRNKRAQYYWQLRDRFEATYRAVEKGVYIDPSKLISLDEDGIDKLQLLKSELTATRRKRTDNTLIQAESKIDMKKRGVASPNGADALCMAFANLSPIAQNHSSGIPQPSRVIGRR